MVLLGNKLTKIAAAVFLLPLFSIAQNTIYSEEYNYNTKLAPVRPGTEQTIIYYNAGFVYTVPLRGAYDTDVLTINRYDPNNKSLKTITIKKTKDNKMFFNQYIDAIAFLGNKLVTLNYKYIFTFVKINDAEYKLSKVIKNDGSFNRLFALTPKEVLCYVNYHFHPLDEANMHTWAKLNITNDSLGAEKHMDDGNVLFSYFVNSWLSTYKGLIAYSHTTDYSINFYNDKLEIIDSIRSNKLDQNKVKLYSLPDGSGHSVDDMNAISKADDTLLNRIQKIYLLDSTHLLLTVKQAKTKHYIFDLWQKTEKGWIIKKSSDLPSYYEDGKEYTGANNSVTGFFGNFDGFVYAGNNDFYFFYYPFMENVISKSYNSQVDYFDKENELARKKELYYGIKKIKVLTD